MDRETVDIYEARAREWETARAPTATDAARFASRLTAGDTPVLDLGCGPGGHLRAFPSPRIGLDATFAFVRRVRDLDPGAGALQADLARLPLRRGSMGSVWANKSLVHLARSDVPMALWDLHRVLRPGAPVHLGLFGGDQELGPVEDDDFPGRAFSLWPDELLDAVLEGAGLVDVTIERTSGRRPTLGIGATRAPTLADTVGPRMALLCVGLNPSPYAAEVGVGFARPGNRFWPAALAAGIVSRDRDPEHALRVHGLGMTDLVKRATPRADELGRDEYRHGVERLTTLVSWLRPAVVCIVGLAGWRAAVHRTATTGWQPSELGGRPVYVMPNPSGLNAHDTVTSLAEHLRSAARGPVPG